MVPVKIALGHVILTVDGALTIESMNHQVFTLSLKLFADYICNLCRNRCSNMHDVTRLLNK